MVMKRILTISFMLLISIAAMAQSAKVTVTRDGKPTLTSVIQESHLQTPTEANTIEASQSFSFTLTPNKGTNYPWNGLTEGLYFIVELYDKSATRIGGTLGWNPVSGGEFQCEKNDSTHSYTVGTLEDILKYTDGNKTGLTSSEKASLAKIAFRFSKSKAGNDGGWDISGYTYWFNISYSIVEPIVSVNESASAGDYNFSEDNCRVINGRTYFPLTFAATENADIYFKMGNHESLSMESTLNPGNSILRTDANEYIYSNKSEEKTILVDVTDMNTDGSFSVTTQPLASGNNQGGLKVYTFWKRVLPVVVVVPGNKGEPDNPYTLAGGSAKIKVSSTSADYIYFNVNWDNLDTDKEQDTGGSTEHTDGGMATTGVTHWIANTNPGYEYEVDLSDIFQTLPEDAMYPIRMRFAAKKTNSSTEDLVSTPTEYYYDVCNPIITASPSGGRFAESILPINLTPNIDNTRIYFRVNSDPVISEAIEYEPRREVIRRDITYYIDNVTQENGHYIFMGKQILEGLNPQEIDVHVFGAVSCDGEDVTVGRTTKFHFIYDPEAGIRTETDYTFWVEQNGQKVSIVNLADPFNVYFATNLPTTTWGGGPALALPAYIGIESGAAAKNFGREALTKVPVSSHVSASEYASLFVLEGLRYGEFVPEQTDATMMKVNELPFWIINANMGATWSPSATSIEITPLYSASYNVDVEAIVSPGYRNSATPYTFFTFLKDGVKERDGAVAISTSKPNAIVYFVFGENDEFKNMGSIDPTTSGVESYLDWINRQDGGEHPGVPEEGQIYYAKPEDFLLRADAAYAGLERNGILIDLFEFADYNELFKLQVLATLEDGEIGNIDTYLYQYKRLTNDDLPALIVTRPDNNKEIATNNELEIEHDAGKYGAFQVLAAVATDNINPRLVLRDDATGIQSEWIYPDSHVHDILGEDQSICQINFSIDDYQNTIGLTLEELRKVTTFSLRLLHVDAVSGATTVRKEVLALPVIYSYNHIFSPDVTVSKGLLDTRYIHGDGEDGTKGGLAIEFDIDDKKDNPPAGYEEGEKTKTIYMALGSENTPVPNDRATIVDLNVLIANNPGMVNSEGVFVIESGTLKDDGTIYKMTPGTKVDFAAYSKAKSQAGSYMYMSTYGEVEFDGNTYGDNIHRYIYQWLDVPGMIDEIVVGNKTVQRLTLIFDQFEHTPLNLEEELVDLGILDRATANTGSWWYTGSTTDVNNTYAFYVKQEYQWYMDDVNSAFPAFASTPTARNQYQAGFKPWVDTAEPTFAQTNTTWNANGQAVDASGELLTPTKVPGDYKRYYVGPRLVAEPAIATTAFAGLTPDMSGIAAGQKVFNSVTSTQRGTIQAAYDYRTSTSTSTLQNSIECVVDVYIRPVKTDSEGRPISQEGFVTLFLEDFGSSTSVNIGPELGGKLTTYKYASKGLPNDGEYTIIRQTNVNFNSGGGRPGDWTIDRTDYTTQSGLVDESLVGTGFMYMVNADATANGQFYEQTISVCAGIPLRFSLRVKNACNGNSGYYRIKPNILVRLTDVKTNNVVKEFYTGGIEMSENWEYHYVDFTTEADGLLKVEYLNVNLGGDGNDFMIDNIRIQRQASVLSVRDEAEEKCSILIPNPIATFDPIQTYEEYYGHAVSLEEDSEDEKLFEDLLVALRNSGIPAYVEQANRYETFVNKVKKKIVYYWQMVLPDGNASEENNNKITIINYETCNIHLFYTGLMLDESGELLRDQTTGEYLLIDGSLLGDGDDYPKVMNTLNELTLKNYVNVNGERIDLKYHKGEIQLFAAPAYSRGGQFISTPNNSMFGSSCLPSTSWINTSESIEVKVDGYESESSISLCAGDGTENRRLSITTDLTAEQLDEIRWWWSLNPNLDEMFELVDGSYQPITDENGDPLATLLAEKVKSYTFESVPAASGTYYVTYGSCPAYAAKFNVKINPKVDIDWLKDATTGLQANTATETIEGVVRTVFRYRTCYEAGGFWINIPVEVDETTWDSDHIRHRIDVISNDGTIQNALTATFVAFGEGILSLYFSDGKYPVSWNNMINGTNNALLKITLGYGDDFAGESSCSAKLFVRLRMTSANAVWTGPTNLDATNPTNWNNDAYWKIYQANTAGNAIYTDDGSLTIIDAEAGVPMACTNVLIPGKSTVYPDLGTSDNTNNIIDYGFTEDPTCNTVTFEMGGVLNRQDLLNYYEAYVEFNYGYYSGNGLKEGTHTNFRTGSSMIEREHFYLISAPLKEMYTGDFSFAGKPNSHLRYAVEIDIPKDPGSLQYEMNDIEGMINLSTDVEKLNVPVELGFGFALLINGNDPSASPITDSENNLDVVFVQGNLNRNQGVVKYPRFMHEKFGPQVSGGVVNYGFNHLENFVLGNIPGGTTSGYTHWRYYYTDNPDDVVDHPAAHDYAPRNKTVVEINGIKKEVWNSNRFLIEDEGTATISPRKITEGEGYHDVLIGNPFIAYLDFYEFQKENSGLKTYYRLLSDGGNVYTYYFDSSGNVYDNANLTGDLMDPKNRYLAPMQAFFAGVNEVNNNEISLSFDTKKMTAVPDAKDIEVVNLRNNTGQPEVLKISVANEEAKQTTAVLICQPEYVTLGEGVNTVLSGRIAPEIYIHQDDKAKVIAEIDNTITSVPLGIANLSNSDELSLKFNGIQSFYTDTKIKLYDSEKDLFLPLETEGQVYKFACTKSKTDEIDPLLNRFFIVFKRNHSQENAIDDLNTPIIVSVNSGIVNITSSPYDLIRSVKIVNIQGQIIHAEGQIDRAGYQTSLPLASGVYLIDIETEKQSAVKKIIIK